MSDFDAATIINNFDINIDILIDLSGHTYGNRLSVFSYKPAPVQMSWLGYFATTGLREMDYFLGDPHMLPEGEENHFIENVWRLSESWLCLKPPNFQIEVSVSPLKKNGFCTFGSFGNISKINDQVVEVWASVLSGTPRSKLFIKANQLIDSLVVDDVQKRFEVFGIGSDRLILEGASSRLAYFEAYNEIDLVLDTFPYPGGTTSIDALWMGVPVLTLKGDRFLSHLGESIAINAGNQNWIAKDIEEYITKAVNFSLDSDRHSQSRSSFRDRILKSPLFDTDRFARCFGDALWGMWRHSQAN